MAATSSTARRSSTSASCGGAPDSVCATARRSGRSVSTSGSRWIPASLVESSNRVARSTSASARRSKKGTRYQVRGAGIDTVRIVGMRLWFTVLLAACLVGAAAGARAQVIDRFLAVVDGAIIMQSDVAAAILLNRVPSAGLATGSGPSRPSSKDAADPAGAALDRLIERQLVLSEVDRYAPPDPADADINRQVSDIRSHAGTDFDRIL